MSEMQVSIIRCGGYEPDTVYHAVSELLDRLGGMGRFVKPGMRVYVKPNILGRHAPGEAITTHPEVAGAVARLALEAGAAEVLIGDCPGGSGAEGRVDEVYRVSGYADMAARVGAKMAVNVTRTVRSVQNGVSAHSFELVQEMLGADLLINIAKAKTHQLCAFTGAVKNLYGTIYGRDKRKYHAMYPTQASFSNFLIDISETVKPALSIMDAIIGIEGPGPAAGYPRRLGALLASESPYALDAVTVHLIGWKQSDVPLLGYARERGLLPPGLGDIGILGEDIGELRLNKPFMKPTMTAQATIRLAKLLPRRLREALQARPFVSFCKCIGCGECVEACPVRAINLSDRKPAIDYGKCIQCFCCQELCPEKAIEARKGFVK